MSGETTLVNPYTNAPVWYHVCCVGHVPASFDMQTCGDATYSETYMMSVPPHKVTARDIDNLLLCPTAGPIEFEEIQVDVNIGADCSILDPRDFFRDLEPHLALEFENLLSNDKVPPPLKPKAMSQDLREDLLYGCAGSASLNQWVIEWANTVNGWYALRRVCNLRMGFWKIMLEIVNGGRIHDSDLHLVHNLAGWLERECRVYNLASVRNGQNLAIVCDSAHSSPYIHPYAVSKSKIDMIGVTHHRYESR